MGIKVDFHTHSVASPDGSLAAKDYRRMIEQGKLDYIAVTDHNTTDFGLELQQSLGDRIIVGEEITTLQGEVIGLYLKQTVPAGLSAAKAVDHIRTQGGLVYIPHPFETVRKGITKETLDSIAENVDIIEVLNGRAVFQDQSKQATAWAAEHKVAAAAASDAHGILGWGRTYTVLGAAPTRENLVELLQKATRLRAFPGIPALLYPKFNRLRKSSRG